MSKCKAVLDGDKITNIKVKTKEQQEVVSETKTDKPVVQSEKSE